MHGHMYISYAYAKDKERMKCVGTVIASIDTAQMYTLHPPVIHTYTRRKPRRRLAILLMIGAFSTRRPAMAFIPDVRLVCHRLPPAFVPTMFRPLSCSPEATTQHPLRVIRWSHNAYITHYYAAAALIPERLRWNIARAGNRLPLACALRCAAFPACRSLRRRLLVVIPSAIGQ